jgi:hypothetical protein
MNSILIKEVRYARPRGTSTDEVKNNCARTFNGSLSPNSIVIFLTANAHSAAFSVAPMDQH